MDGVTGKNVLVTGASSGIGKDIAISFAREGANVCINYVRSKEGAEDTLEKIKALENYDKIKVFIHQADVSQEDQLLGMIKKTITQFGSIDILVNNAAVQKNIPSHKLPTEEYEWVLNINLKGVFMASREVIAHFLEREYQGVIINISSPHEIIPKPGYLPYSISKGGLGNLTRTLALEYARKGIRVNSVAPGAIITRLNNAWAFDKEKRAVVENNIPMGYAGEPEHISPSVLFLASDNARYITGITMYVDGGAVLYPSYMSNWSS